MDLETILFILSPDGEKLLEIAKSLSGSFLTRLTTLRKQYPAPIASAALELLELRQRARKKFSKAEEMFFTREALEQSSGEVISRYRAERFPQNGKILDLACGIGGDTIGLASRCIVTAVDNDPVRIAIAERNLHVYGLTDRVTFICTDVTDIQLKADAAFLDPSRRSEGRRVVKLSQINPPLEFIHRLVEAIPECAVKLSPASDDSELEALNGEIEFLSDSGECKEALVWFGKFKTTAKRATVLPDRESLIYEPVQSIPVMKPGKYLYEPDACIIRAHLIEHVASQIGAWKINDQIAYLSSDTLTKTPYADAYEILESLPFNPKTLKRTLNAMSAGKIVVKKRGVPFEPREMEKRLKTSGNREFIVVLTRISKNSTWAFICSPDRA